MGRKSFAGLELMILIAVVVGIIVILFGATNIFDQIAKTSDSNTLEIARQLNSSIIRSYGNSNSYPWEGELSATSFSSEEGRGIVEKIMAAGELQKNFVKISGKKLSSIFITTLSDDHFTICFKPESKFYSLNSLAKFKKTGEEDCQKDCHICLNDGLGKE